MVASNVEFVSTTEEVQDREDDSPSVPPEKKHKSSRENTSEKKKRMRRNRKKRKCYKVSKTVIIETLEKEVTKQKEMREEEKRAFHYRSVARSYWERWNWELKQRKGAMLRERALSTKCLGSVTVAATNLLEIDPALLHDPVLNGTETEVYLGQGAFCVVQLKLFRGIKVAVKKMQPKTVMSDVRNAACILAQLSHPILPHLFGVCTAILPYRIIMQFHGLGDAAKSFTMSHAIVARKDNRWTCLAGYCYSAYAGPQLPS